MSNEKNLQAKLKEAFCKLAKEGKIKSHSAATVIEEIKKAKSSGSFNEKAFFHDMFFALKEIKEVDSQILKDTIKAYEQGIASSEDKK